MRVGIVGGGITGLTLTHALARVGIESVVFESEDRPGGVIRTAVLDGRPVEQGPQRTRLVPTVRRLVQELDLENRVLRAREDARLYIWVRGALRQVPARPLGLLRSNLLTVRGRGRSALEPLTQGLRDGETVAGFFARKVGDEAYRSLFGPLISATFAADPAAMPARHSLPMIFAPLGVRRSLLAAAQRWRSTGAAAVTFAGGLSELTDALALRHADRVRLATRVTRVTAVGPCYDVHFRTLTESEAAVERVDRVVLTTPAAAAAEVLNGLAPRTSASLARLTHNEVTIVNLASPARHQGFGYQAALDSSLRTRGVTWTGSLFGREGSGRDRAFTAYLGGGLDPEVSGWTDQRVGEFAARDFRQVHGLPARVLAVSRAQLPAYDVTWDGLDTSDLPAGVVLAANYRGRLGISARIAEAEELALRFAEEGARPGAGAQLRTDAQPGAGGDYSSS